MWESQGAKQDFLMLRLTFSVFVLELPTVHRAGSDKMEGAIHGVL